jgi:hypothetical protein
MSTATPVAVATARKINNKPDSSKAIVRFKHDRTYLCVENSVPFEVEKLIRNRWLITPMSARQKGVTIFKQ